MSVLLTLIWVSIYNIFFGSQLLFKVSLIMEIVFFYYKSMSIYYSDNYYFYAFYVCLIFFLGKFVHWSSSHVWFYSL